MKWQAALLITSGLGIMLGASGDGWFVLGVIIAAAGLLWVRP